MDGNIIKIVISRYDDIILGRLPHNQLGKNVLERMIVSDDGFITPTSEYTFAISIEDYDAGKLHEFIKEQFNPDIVKIMDLNKFKLDPTIIRKYLLDHEGFTEFNDSDRNTYDAEPIDDNHNPIIKHTDDFDIIFDKNGFSFENEMKSLSFEISNQ